MRLPGCICDRRRNIIWFFTILTHVLFLSTIKKRPFDFLSKKAILRVTTSLHLRLTAQTSASTVFSTFRDKGRTLCSLAGKSDPPIRCTAQEPSSSALRASLSASASAPGILCGTFCRLLSPSLRFDDYITGLNRITGIFNCQGFRSRVRSVFLNLFAGCVTILSYKWAQPKECISL